MNSTHPLGTINQKKSKIKLKSIHHQTSQNNEEFSLNYQVNDTKWNCKSLNHFILQTLEIQKEQQNSLPFIIGPTIQKENIQTKQNDTKEPKCYEILCPKFSIKSFNFLFLSLLFLFYLIFYLYYSFGPEQYYGCALYTFGAKFTPSIRFQGHVHRLIIPIFLFGNFAHFGLMLTSFLVYGFLLEHMFNWKKYLFLLLNGGLMGTLLSAIIYPYHVTTNSVGMIFSLFMLQLSGTQGIKIILINGNRAVMLTLFCILFGSNFLYLYDPKAADIGGIMGGILSGILISIGYYDRPENACWKKIQIFSLILVFGIDIALIAVTFTLNIKNISLTEFC